MSRDIQQRIKALRSLERRVQPNEAWIRATRETLCMQVRNSMPSQATSPVRFLGYSLRNAIPAQVLQYVRGPVMAVVSVFLVVLGGSIASVSAAEQSLPGDFLYTLKLATEQARLALTPAKEEKLKLKVEFTVRRVEELKSVAKKDVPARPVRVAQAAEILKRDLNTVKQQLDDVKTTSESHAIVEAAKLVDQTTTKAVQTLQETKADLSDDVKEKVTEAQAVAADTGVTAIHVLAEKHQESQDAIPEHEVVQALEEHTKTVADVTGVTFAVSSTASVENAGENIALTSSTSMIVISGTGTVPLVETVEKIKQVTQDAFAAQKTTEINAALSVNTSTHAGEDGLATSTSSSSASSSSANVSTSSTASSSSSLEVPSNHDSSTSALLPP